MTKIKHFKKNTGIIMAVILACFLIIPLLILYPEGKFNEKQLADKDSHFIKIDGLDVHYKIYGTGKNVYIMFHGTLATTYTWHEVVRLLAENATVILYDRPAFGLTSRPMRGDWNGNSPYGYEEQADLVIKLMDRLGIDLAMFTGNSMGGAIAWLAVQRHPERVKALILVDTVQSKHALPSALRFLSTSPQLKHIGVNFINNNVEKFGNYLYPLSYHNPSKIKKEYFKEYFKIFEIKNFELGLWELLIAAKPFENLLDAGKINIPTLIIAGDDDRVAGIKKPETGTQDLIQLSKKIKNCRLEVIKNCGHVPQEECPEEFVKVVKDFTDKLDNK